MRAHDFPGGVAARVTSEALKAEGSTGRPAYANGDGLCLSFLELLLRPATRMAEALDPVDPAVAAAVMAMAGLELEGADGQPLNLKPVSCYRPPADRVARLATVDPSHGLTPENTVAVTCSVNGDESEVVETIVAASAGGPPTHCVFTDPIYYSETSLAALVEGQFEEGGPWTTSRGADSAFRDEKANHFKHYEAAITQQNPECLATLRRMLQAGPITRCYSGGGRPPHVKSHEGFSLRMPPEELPQWQTLGDKGDLQDIRRPSHALRAWDARARRYTPIDPTLDGAPSTPAATDEWYVGVVRKLASSHYIGHPHATRLLPPRRRCCCCTHGHAAPSALAQAGAAARAGLVGEDRVDGGARGRRSRQRAPTTASRAQHLSSTASSPAAGLRGLLLQPVDRSRPRRAVTAQRLVCRWLLAWDSRAGTSAQMWTSLPDETTRGRARVRAGT